MRVDVLVAGGGPAGAAAALTLLRYTDLRVALVERSRYEAWRVGEMLPAGAQPLLEYLGAWPAFVAQGHRPSHATGAAWGTPAVQWTHAGQGAGWQLDRRRFDAGLAALVRDLGGLVLTGARVTGEQRGGGDGWRVTVRAGGQDAELDARRIVDATGRSAAVARRHGARRAVDDRLVGVVGRLRLAGAPPAGGTLVEAVEEGWWYTAPQPDGTLVAALLSDSDLVRASALRDPDRWLALAAGAPGLSARAALRAPDRRPAPGLSARAALAAPDGRPAPGLSARAALRAPDRRPAPGLSAPAAPRHLAGAPVVRPAFSQRLDPIAGDGWIAAGEAAAAFDPLSSFGIGHALASGIAAARAVDLALNGDAEAPARYGARAAEHYARYRASQASVYAFERRWPQAPFWARRQSPATAGAPAAAAVATGPGARSPRTWP